MYFTVLTLLAFRQLDSCLCGITSAQVQNYVLLAHSAVSCPMFWSTSAPIFRVKHKMKAPQSSKSVETSIIQHILWEPHIMHIWTAVELLSPFSVLTSSAEFSRILLMSHSTDGSGMLMNFAAVATLGKMWFCSAWSSHKELSIAWLFRGSRSSMMYGSKLTRKEYLVINALVQDVSFTADLHTTAITAAAGLCMIQLPCSADWRCTLCIIHS